jgi:hypothetical protein
MAITVAARSKTWTDVASSNTGIVDLNPTQGMDVCVHLFYVCVVLCVGSGHGTGPITRPKSPVICVKILRNWRRGQGPTKGCRNIDEWMNEWMNDVHYNCDCQRDHDLRRTRFDCPVLSPAGVGEIAVIFQASRISSFTFRLFLYSVCLHSVLCTVLCR